MAAWVGALLMIVSAVLFGSMFVPAKKINSGDGMFFQWIMCVVICSYGMVVNIIRDSPQFEPLAMLGGVFWALGIPFIIQSKIVPSIVTYENL